MLRLEKVSKIYMTEGNTTIGLNGISARFSVGEFIAVTGSSGAGKSTLLNVLGGMDSYEEGELFIEGSPTSYFDREDWENYQRKYISFVFQNTGLIDCLTALENVQLALSEEKNGSEEALELLKKVGMESFRNQKAGMLSGGQRQRVAIARALARHTPIILADEPTGNLDSENANAVVELLRDLSRDHLILAVTHNFAEFSDSVTRVIRMQDGKISEDTVLRPSIKPSGITGSDTEKQDEIPKTESLKKGIHWGWRLFRARPKTSLYTCLMIGLAGILLQLFAGLFGMLIYQNYQHTNYVFKENDSRVIVTKRDGTAFTEEEISAVQACVPDGILQINDCLQDAGNPRLWKQYFREPDLYECDPTDIEFQIPFSISVLDDKETVTVGRTPETAGECLLELPYALKNTFGSSELKQTTVVQNGLEYNIVGLRYYSDNTKQGRMLLTEEGYRINAAIRLAYGTLQAKLTLLDETDAQTACSTGNLKFSCEIGQNQIFWRRYNNTDVVKSVDLLFQDEDGTSVRLAELSGNSVFVNTPETDLLENNTIVVNPYLVIDKLTETEGEQITQCSVLLSNAGERKKAAEELNRAGFFAVSADLTVKVQDASFTTQLLLMLIPAILLICIIFLMSFLIRIVIGNALKRYEKDTILLRFAGNGRKTARLSFSIRFLIPVLFGILMILLFQGFAYRIAVVDRYVLYLHAPLLGLVILALAVTVMRTAGKAFRKIEAQSLVSAANRREE